MNTSAILAELADLSSYKPSKSPTEAARISESRPEADTAAPVHSGQTVALIEQRYKARLIEHYDRVIHALDGLKLVLEEVKSNLEETTDLSESPSAAVEDAAIAEEDEDEEL
jgi:hypothetical protein